MHIVALLPKPVAEPLMNEFESFHGYIREVKTVGKDEVLIGLMVLLNIDVLVLSFWMMKVEEVSFSMLNM
jgi:hypothetical protein